MGGHHDVILGTAYVMHEDMVCNGCGHYKDEAWNRPDGEFAMDDTLTCGACAAREKYQREQRTHPILGLIGRIINTRTGSALDRLAAPADGHDHHHGPVDSMARLSAPATSEGEQLLG